MSDGKTSNQVDKEKEEGEQGLTDEDESTFPSTPSKTTCRSHHNRVIRSPSVLGSSLERWKFITMMNYRTMKPPKFSEEEEDASEPLSFASALDEQLETPPRRKRTVSLQALVLKPFPRIYDDGSDNASDHSDLGIQRRSGKRKASNTDDEGDEGGDDDEGLPTKQQCLDLIALKRVPLTSLLQERSPADYFITPPQRLLVGSPKPPPRPGPPKGRLPMFISHDSPSLRNHPPNTNIPLVGSPEFS